MNKSIPKRVEYAAKNIETPFHIYDEMLIRENSRKLHDAFSWVQNLDGSENGFKNYFAVKALPNPHILNILKEENMGFDCSSGAELEMMKRLGVRGEEIIFTSNNTPMNEYQKATELGAIVNFDDISHIDDFMNNLGVPETFCLRYNPGSVKKGNEIIGNPEQAKFGFTKKDVMKAYPMMRDMGSKRFGLHAMIASNELQEEYFIETAKILFDLVVELYKKEGIKIEFINLGGGIGIPYHPNDNSVNYYKS